MTDKEMCRGDTMLISIDAPTEYPVTTLQDLLARVAALEGGS